MSHFTPLHCLIFPHGAGKMRHCVTPTYCIFEQARWFQFISPADAHNPCNYPSISLTSVHYNIRTCHLFWNTIFFHQSQHGFCKSFSCESQLLLFTENFHTILDTGHVTNFIFLDLAKALDKLLILKLWRLSTDPLILQWIQNFLFNRTQYNC